MPFPDPGVTPPTLDDYQFNFGDFTFGGFGGFYDLLPDGLTGLDQTPIRASDADRPRDQGQLIGLNLYGPRDIIVDVGVLSDGTSLSHARHALEAAVAPQVVAETPFYAQLPGQDLLVCMARNTRYSWALTQAAILLGLDTVSMMFHATDPRWYLAPTTASGPVAPSASITLDNTGTVEMRPVLVITGPATGLTIANSTYGAALTFTNPAAPVGGDLPTSSDTLTVDLDLGIVTAFISGVTYSAPQWQTTGSVWWNLQPGSNVIDFSCVSSSSGAGCTINWSPAYRSV